MDDCGIMARKQFLHLFPKFSTNNLGPTQPHLHREYSEADFFLVVGGGGSKEARW
jgi:hypothetical protein